MKKRVIGFIAAVVLAMVGTTLLVAYVKGAEDRALAGETIVEVYVVQSRIDQGTPGEDIEDMVLLERIPTKVQVDGAVAALEDIEGLVAAVDLLPGEQITLDRFVVRTSVSRYARTEDAPPGYLEMTMSLSPERFVGGSVTPGDTVAIVASFEPFEISQATLPEGLDLTITTEQLDQLLETFFENDALTGDKTPSVSHILEHKALVTNVQEEELPTSTLGDDGEVVTTGASIAPTGNLLVTVALDAPAIERLVFANEFGSIWIAAEPSNASEDGTMLVDRGNVFNEGGG
jgi:pilus assembly protein CpaB